MLGWRPAALLKEHLDKDFSATIFRVCELLDALARSARLEPTA